MNNWTDEIKKRVLGIPKRGGRSSRDSRFGFEELVFLPAQLNKTPVDYFKDDINSKTVIGKLSKRPIVLNTPIVFGAMSFGALSKEAKISLAKASTIIGTCANTGEGGVLPEERSLANLLIVQYSTGRFGITEDILKKADVIEIKIGQGAKPGQGGLLPKEKITDEISEIRNVGKLEDVHSPASHFDIKNISDLRKKIDWLRVVTNGKPIILKLGAGDIERDVKLAISANPDIIAIDGMYGGTGASFEVMLDDVGVPTLPALVKARKILDKLKAKQELWIGGGFSKGSDYAKALALGADMVFVGFPLLIAMGCVYCKQCSLGKCPLGITTQDELLRQKLNIELASKNIANYVKNCTEEIKMIAGAVGEDNIYNLNKSHLVSLNSEISKVLKVNFID